MMKALIKTSKGKGNLELRDVPLPKAEDDEVLIRVHSCGICGTDLKIYDDLFITDPPVIIGHEFSGIIEDCGSKVQRFEKGMRVIAEQHFQACGVCEECLTGNRQWCNSKRSPGYLSDGAFAEYIVVKENLLHDIPDGITMEQATLVEPMGIVAFALLRRCKVSPGESVLILGCGPIAMLALQLVKASGASKIYITGIDADEKKRFAIARQYGADATINVLKQSAPEIIFEETKGRGVDVVVDLAGVESAIQTGFDCVRKGGRFAAIGMAHGALSVDWQRLVLKAIKIIFSYSSDYLSWKTCLSMISNGSIKLDDFTRDIYPIGEWGTAFAKARSGEALKVIIQP